MPQTPMIPRAAGTNPEHITLGWRWLTPPIMAKSTYLGVTPVGQTLNDLSLGLVTPYLEVGGFYYNVFTS